MNDEIWITDLFNRDYALLVRIGFVFLGTNAAQQTIIEDQIQETFLRAWNKRRALQKHPNPDGWLVECFRKCLMNACRKTAREAKRLAFFSPDESRATVEPNDQTAPDAYVASKEQVELLIRLLGKKDADVFIRYCISHEKAASIAHDYQISEQALRMRVSRIKRKLVANQGLFLALVTLLFLESGLRR